MENALMWKPAIVAPVMRYIGVRDVARSSAFYENVLGFEIRRQPDAAEAVCGPARVGLGKQGYAPLEWENPRPPGSAMLFFETDDLDALHAAVRARGGQPSEIEKVNGIKMRLFEVRDPDGHTLWFGQSYNVPDAPAPRGLLERIMPGLPLDDVPAGVAYYRDVLGFSVNYQQHDLGVMDRDGVRLLLIARTGRHTGIGSAYVYVENADALYAELRAKGANVEAEPVSRPWGLREFRVFDPEGNEITFGQPFE
jgi:catechol 2,3-dioxygenase-like lactoylglutathione lyase family enzyme